MLKLAAVFENAVGKKHNWSFNEPDPNKSPEEIRSALEAMTALHLFEKDGIRQFCKVVSAKFVETIETPLFDLSKPTPEAYVADPNNIFAAHIVSEEMNQAPGVNEVKEETVVVEEAKIAEVIAPKAVEVATKPFEEKNAVAAMKTPVVESNSLVAMTEKTTKSMSSMIPSASAQQLEALANQSEPEPSAAVSSDSPTVPKPVNPRKAQVDRVRAYHEANKKKKKGKKKKR